MDRLDAVDEGVDDAPHAGIVAGPVPERPHPEHEPVGEHVDLELERAVPRCGRDRRRGERELVDAVDREVEPRAQPPQDEGDDTCAARAGGDGEEDPVRHETVAGAGPAVAGGSPSRLRAVPENQLTLSTEVLEGVRVTHVAGELDLSTVEAFEAELDRSFVGRPQVVVLAECTFIDSSALRALVRAQQRISEAGGRFAVVAPSQPARRTLEIAGLDGFVSVFETLGEAVTSSA